MKELTQHELKQINGGEISGWWKVAGFLISPMFGLFNAGLIDGLNEK